jgi:hypothetical protein
MVIKKRKFFRCNKTNFFFKIKKQMNFKNLLLLLLGFFFTINCVSQDKENTNLKESKKYTISIKLGATGSFFNTEVSHFPKNGFDSSFRLGAVFGGQFNYFLKENSIISGGLQVNSRGG